jgi:predicted acyltransferase (DUF342 family)
MANSIPFFPNKNLTQRLKNSATNLNILKSNNIFTGVNSFNNTLYATNGFSTNKIYTGSYLEQQYKTSGACLFTNNITDSQSNLNGVINNDLVFNQFQFGGRPFVFGNGAMNDDYMYFGSIGNNSSLPDYEYCFKRGTGLQINPDASISTGAAPDFDVALSVIGNESITGDLTVDGTSVLTELLVNGTTTMDTVNVQGTLTVDGNVVLGDTVSVSVNQDMLVKGSMVVKTTLSISGETTMNSTLFVDDSVIMANTLNVAGETTVTGTLNVGENVNIENTLTVSGASILDSRLNVGEDAVFESSVSIGNNLTVDKNITAEEVLIISDDLLKTNIRPFTADEYSIDQLTPVSYHLKKNPDRLRLGLIAQDRN